METGAFATTVDRLLGGLIEIEQPARGRHRAGLDAILLAAAVPENAVGRLVDLGAGVGTAGLAAAARAPGLSVTLVERDPDALRLAAAGLARPANAAFAARVRIVEGDVTGPAAALAAAGLGRESADYVLMNPPFFAPRDVRASPAEARAAAHVLPEGGLERWMRKAASLAAPQGRLALVFRGDALGAILEACAGRFGALAIHPVHPRVGEAAHRVVVTGIKGSRAATRIMPGLVLHPADSNGYLPEADAILRGQCGLA